MRNKGQIFIYKGMYNRKVSSPVRILITEKRFSNEYLVRPRIIIYVWAVILKMHAFELKVV